jgi:hypothetical protein
VFTSAWRRGGFDRRAATRILNFFEDVGVYAQQGYVKPKVVSA